MIRETEKFIEEKMGPFAIIFMESASDAIIISDSDDVILYWNKAATVIFGHTKEEAIGKKVHNLLVPSKFLEKHAAALPEFQRTGQGEAIGRTLDLDAVRKDGKEIYIELSLSSFCIEEDRYALGIIRDVTGRKLAEERMKQLFAAMEVAADGMAILGKDQTYTFLNKAHHVIYGYSAGELDGESWRILYDREELQRFDQEIVPKLMETGHYQGRAWGKKKDGTTFPQGLSLTLLENGGMVCIVRDISERVREEEKKQELEKLLFHASKMESIGTLAGGIAHDFNNLLAVIGGNASLAIMELNNELHPICTRLKQIEGQVKRGSDLTNQLLRFAHMRAYNVKPIDVNEILERTSSMFGQTRKEIAIRKKYGENLWAVDADSGQIEQVIMNLLVNASQAMAENGNIYLETDNIILKKEESRFYSIDPGRYVKIAITDTGMGIDKNIAKKIFEPFFTTKGMEKGTGLGLAMVYAIIKDHKGIINVDSEPDQGATFTIFLPASEKEAGIEKKEAEFFSRGDETLLLVDDEEKILGVNKEMLEYMGYKVYGARSGKEASEIYQEKSDEIDLTILDVVMPEMSGKETFEHIRMINPEAKIILLSGYSLDGDAEVIMRQGCNGFLQKPFQITELSKKIREVLDR
jgi:PAS domain S-box-containing protein